MKLETVVVRRLTKIKNELAQGGRHWKKVNIIMSKMRREYPARSDWDGTWYHPYEDKREYQDAQREVYNIINNEIKLKEEKRYLHDLVRKSKK